MPGFNQTGPMGQGPMTGRKMGKCNNANNEENKFGNGSGRRNGSCCGRGRGRNGGGFSNRNGN